MSKQKLPKEKNWYVIHTYSGYENAVAKSLRKRKKSLGMEDKIFQVLVPKEKKVELNDGEKETVDEKIFPGYVLVQMIVTDDSWYVVRNTPNVTGFVGSGTTPVPVSEEEVDMLMSKMKKDEPEYKIDVEEGDVVKITDGPFKDFEGKVSEVDQERGKVKVLVDMFGRDTPVELDSLQIEKV